MLILSVEAQVSRQSARPGRNNKIVLKPVPFGNSRCLNEGMIDGCPDRSCQRIGNSPGWDWSRGLTLQQPPRESRPTAFSRAHRLETPYICAEMDLEQFSVEELVAQARALAGSQEGDRLANELFRRHYSQVACWCLRTTGDRELAADLAQEIFVRAHQHLKSFQGQSKFSTWLYSIARNQCMNAVKARSIRPAEISDEDLVETSSPSRRLRDCWV
jgi:hypothetical protein